MPRCARLAKVVGGALAVWATAAVVLVSAQGRLEGRLGKGAMAQPRLPDLPIDGTVEDVRPGLLQVLSNSGQSWVLRILPQARIQITGKATPDFLGPGQCIAFVADVEVRRARVEQPVSKLVLFNPSPDRPLGAAEDQGMGLSLFAEKGGENKAQRGKPPFGAAPRFGPGPAFGPGLEEGPALGSKEPRAGSRRARSGPVGPGGRAAPATQSLEVRGQITSFKGGKATLHVPNAPFRGALKIEIAEDAEIDVQLSSLAAVALAQKGDKVHARGQQLGERAGQVSDLEITLSETLGAGQAKKRPASKAERPGGSKRAAQPAEKAPGIEPQSRKDTKEGVSSPERKTQQQPEAKDEG